MSLKKLCWVALLRAIGPTTHKLMSMSQLRDACSDAGFESVQTVLATGNLLFCSDRPKEDIFDILDTIIAQHNLDNKVFLRRPNELHDILTANPLPKAAETRPNHMLVLFMGSAPNSCEIGTIAAYDGPETIKCIGREVYVDYVNGVAGSKLTPARLEKMLGRAGTARNWNTIRKLVEKTSN